MAARPSEDPLNPNVTTKALPRVAGRCFTLRLRRAFFPMRAIVGFAETQVSKARDLGHPALFHRRKIGWTHVRHIDCFHRFFGLLGFEHLLKLWVCPERVPILFRFLAAGMSQHKDECVVPSGSTLGYPVQQNLQNVFGEDLTPRDEKTEA